MICWHDPFRLVAGLGNPAVRRPIAEPSTEDQQRLVQLLGTVEYATIAELSRWEDVTPGCMLKRLERLIISGHVEEAGRIDARGKGPRPMTYRLSRRLQAVA